MGSQLFDSHMNAHLDPCRQYLAKAIHRYLVKVIDAVTVGEIYGLLEKPPQEDMGDFAFPCFKFAKVLRQAPAKIAESIAGELAADPSGWIQKVTTVQAFCNIYVDKGKLAASVIPEVINGQALSGLPSAHQRVMVEYSQPNTHKEFHVGHLRNVCLGSAMVKILRYCGYQVTAANYFGDEGAHIAKCLWMMHKLGTMPGPGDEKGAWLGRVYVQATHQLADAKGDGLAAMELEISRVLSEIENKSGPFYELWLTTRQWSLDAFNAIYKWIGAEFDRDFFESEVSQESQVIVDDLLQRGIFKEDQGAVGIDLSDYKLGFMLARKRDGNTLYATKDLVLAKRKFEEFKIDRSIYVVANEQNHHFRQVFKTLELMGFPQASQCYHLSYGMVVRPDGKMSSRAGNTVPMLELRDQILAEIEKILEKYKGEWTTAELKETAKRLCVGALKYGMLQADPLRDIVFDIKDWLSFEGNTGPYLMYSYARTKSILRKAQESGYHAWTADEAMSKSFKLTAPSELELLRGIYDFNSVVVEAAEQYRPSHLCGHLFQLCKSFNRFYSDVPVLKADQPETIAMRLTLIAAFALTLHQGLALLGITPPEKM